MRWQADERVFSFVLISNLKHITHSSTLTTPKNRMRLSNSYYGICNALSGLKILIISYGRLQITHNNIPLPFPVFQTEFMNAPFHPGGLKAPGYLTPRLPDNSLASTTLYIRRGAQNRLEDGIF